MSKTEPFDRMVDLVLRGGGGRPVWGQRGSMRTGAFDERRFRKVISGGLYFVRALAGDGLFTARSDEENWGKAHRILMPAFSQRR